MEGKGQKYLKEKKNTGMFVPIIPERYILEILRTDSCRQRHDVSERFQDLIVFKGSCSPPSTISQKGNRTHARPFEYL